MDMNYLIAGLYGVLSFFSPCILPLLPVYFGYLTGDAIENIEDTKIKRKLLYNALGFSIGISLLNILLGFGARAIATPLMSYGNVLRILGGLLMLFFGIYFILDKKLMFFEREKKIQYKKYSPSFLKSFILGITFSFGWTPCNGPIIASILIISSFEKNYFKAGTLMLVYSLGFTIMFMLSAFFIGLFLKKSKRLYPYLNIIKKFAGIIMIIMGILLFTDRLSLLNWLN